MRTFTCDGCGRVFNTTTPVAERDVESAALYAGTMDEETGSCCDACWLRILDGISSDPGRIEADKAQEISAKLKKKLGVR